MNLPLSVGVRDHISLDLSGLQHRVMIKIVLVFIVQIIWGSSSSNDLLAVQTSPQLDGDLLASAEVVSRNPVKLPVWKLNQRKTSDIVFASERDFMKELFKL